MKKYKQITTHLLAFILLLLPFAVLAQADFGTGYLDGIGLATTDLRITIINLIRVALNILGVVFFLIIIYGVIGARGSGNEDAKTKSIKIMRAGIIGLVIIVISYSVTIWVMSSILEATV